MTNKQKWLTALFIVVLALGYVGYDLFSLQSGLESASDATLETASANTQAHSPTAPISSYDSFAVSVENQVSVEVHMRESPTATANIFMIHGAGGGAWVWEAYFEQLPERYNLYAISWRGHFTSSAVDNADAADYVVDQLAVLAALESRNNLPIHVVGHSYGGATSVLTAAQAADRIASLHLVAPVVPLDYTIIQEQLVPLIMAPILTNASAQALTAAEEAARTGEEMQASGTFAGMFIDQPQMERYWDLYAVKPYSVEKPGLIAVDGLDPAWQVELERAYAAVGESGIPVWILIARYDNVVIPAEQRETAQEMGASAVVFESGHYIQLDSQAEASVDFILTNLNEVDS
ncbi:MAG: alpha/beta hydrolase [Chloroflexota bacterium]